MMPRAAAIALKGGPFDGRTVIYPLPLPEVIVMAERVEADGCVQPGLRYTDYRRMECLRERNGRGRGAGPHIYCS